MCTSNGLFWCEVLQLTTLLNLHNSLTIHQSNYDFLRSGTADSIVSGDVYLCEKGTGVLQANVLVPCNKFILISDDC